MKNIFSSIFLFFSILIYSNPDPISTSKIVAPETSSATITINEGATVQINLSDYATISSGNIDEYEIVTQPVHKATNNGFVHNGGGQYTYTHNGSEAPSDSFTFKAKSGNDESNISTITISITNINDAPTIDDISATVDEGSSVEISPIAKDAENTEVTVTAGNASNGTVTKDATTGVFTYTHDGSDTTSDSFVLTATELANTQNNGLNLLSGTKTVQITITAVNDAPVALASLLDVDEGGSTNGTFAFTDSDSQSVTTSVTTQPTNGTVTISADNPASYTYTHDGSETVTDEFTFNVNDGALSSSATITVAVNPTNDAPIAVDDVYYISATDTIIINKPGVGVLGNDSDPEKNNFTAVLVSNPQNGELTLNSDGTFMFVPQVSTTGAFVTDSFTYAPVDESQSQGNTATVTLNAATLIPIPDSYDLNEGENLQVDDATGLLSNDIDLNNFTIDSLWVVTQPKYGTVTVNTDFKGGFSYQHDGSENLQDAFEYKIKNTNGDKSEKALVNLFAANVNDAPTSTGTKVTVNEGSEKTFSLLYSDSDTAANSIQFTISSQPTNGNIIDLGNGSIRYIHNGSETTSDSFTYSVSDGELSLSSPATVSITVTPVNDLPVVYDQPLTVSEGGSITVNLEADDVETPGPKLTFKLESEPSNGKASISNGQLTYTHNGTETTSDTFTYSANDGTENGAPANVIVTINPVNTSPKTTAVTISLNEGAAATYDLSTNSSDSDTNAANLKYILVTAPTNGAITDPGNSNAAVSAGGQLSGTQITYTHNGGETTSDSFTFKVNDGNSDSNTSTSSIAVTAVNDAPTIDASGTVSVDEKDQVDITISASDVDSSALTYTVVSTPSKGTIRSSDGSNLTSGNTIPGGVVTYVSTTSINANTTDSFQVKVNDGSVDSATATINLAITAINENLPQIILESSATTVNEDVGNVTLTASLVSNSFYSIKRDMDATPVSANSTNSLGYLYLGEYNGHKYYLWNTSSKTNGEAQSDALAKGGYLVVFETAAEENWVKDKLATANYNNNFWIGLNYKLTGDAWKWINGATYDLGGGYTNWGSTPSQSSSETNQAVYTSRHHSWTNYSASSNVSSYIIEFDNNVTASSNTPVTLTLGSESSAATNNTDYTISATSLTIASGSSSATATISVTNDTAKEGTETITVTAASGDTSVAGVKGSKKKAVISIADDELAVATMSTAKTTYTEGTDSSIGITATLDFAKAFDTTIGLTFSGTATNGVDYTSLDDLFLKTESLSGPTDAYGVVVDSNGNYYVSSVECCGNDEYIYKLASNGTVTKIGSGNHGNFQTAPELGSSAKFRRIRDMAIDSNNKIYFIDEFAVRMLDPSNNRIYFIAGSNDYVNNENMVPKGNSAPVIATAARFNRLNALAVNAAGTIIYVGANNSIKKIYTSDSDNLFTNSANEDWNNIKVANVANNDSEWGEDTGNAANAKFFEPRALALDSNGDLYAADHAFIKKITVGTQSSDPQVTEVLRNDWNDKHGMTIDSADNIYFSVRSNDQIYKYSISRGELTEVINSSENGGTVDGVAGTAKISQPMDLALHPSTGNLVFVQRDDNKLRTIDFSSNIRIDAGETTGSYTLNIKDESFYEDNETIKIVAAASGASINTKNLITESGTDYISFDSTTTKADNATDGTNGIILASDDSAPTVQIVASETSIAENGGVSKVSFTIGGASESGSKMDLDDALKGDYPFIGNFQDHKYYIVQEWVSWETARQNAIALGGYLLTINSVAENNFIQNNIGDNYKWDSYWIGFSDTAEEGTFVWANGSDSTYTNWYDGEPNNAGDEDVVEFNAYSGKWNDLNSNDGRFYIIEFSGTISAKDVVIPYVVSNSVGFSTTSGTDATFTGSGTVTIPAGQSKVDLTVTAVNDSENEDTETITYTITDNITDGTYDEASSTASISIIDDEAPAVTWASSAANFNENGGSITITATSDKAKTTASKLNLTITDSGATQNLDYVVSELQTVNTLAGGSSGFKDGDGSDAKFNRPHGMVSDASGNLYVADNDNRVIRKITPDGVVSTYAGNGEWGHEEPSGNKADVRLAHPRGITFNNAGNELYFTENGRQRISKIDASGNVTVISGNGDWNDAVGDKNNARYQDPSDLAFDSAGNLYVSEDQRIKKLVVDGSGNWTSEYFVGAGSWGEQDGTGENAYFRGIRGFVIDKSGNDDVMYVADENTIRKVTLPGGVVTTWANTNRNWGDNDGTLASAQMQNIKAIAIDASASSLTLYIVDENKLKKVTNDGVETLAGGDYGYADGAFASAKFREPKGIAINSNGIHIADTWNHKIRKIDLLPSITIPAGSTTGSLTVTGLDDQLYESNDEAFTVAVQSVSNVSSAVSSFSDIVTKVISDESAPTIKLTANDDVVDEKGGTVQLVVSLADAFSSAKSDMNGSDKADYYYLGEYNGSKYYASKNQDSGRKSYSDALSTANTLGGQLAVITSAGENDFITSKIYEKDPEYNPENREWLNHWIGHKYNNSSEKWEWTNGAVSDYTNWGWEYNEDYIDRYYSQIRYRGLWFNGESNWHSQYVIEFSSAVSDINASAVIEFGGTSANDGTDYTTSIGAPDADRTVTIPKGQSTATITLTGVDDNLDEAIETITATMKTPSEAVIGADSNSNPINNTATISISDDELPAVTLAVASNTIGEVADAQNSISTSTTITATIQNAKLNPVDISLDFTSSGSGIASFGADFGSNDLNRVTTYAGDGNHGYLDGDADEAEFSDDMKNATVDGSGNLYIADGHNNVIRKVSTDGEVSTYAGTGQHWGNGDVELTPGNKLERSLSRPYSVKINGSYMYVVERDAHQISRINMNTGVLSRYVGKRHENGDDNGNETEAKFNGPVDIAFDSDNQMYVLDHDNTKIRKVVDNGSNRIVTDYAGNGNWGDRDGDALNAELGGLQSIVIDSNDNIYVTTWDRIRKISADGSTVTTVAGEWHDFSDGYGRNARFRNPHGLAIDENDNIYVADQGNNRIRKMSELGNVSQGPKVETISGIDEYDYQDGTADEAAYRRPMYVAYHAGSLYVVDRDDNRIRKVQLTPKMTIPSGQNSVTYNLEAIDDVVYENDETIQFTSNTIVGGTLGTTDPVTLTLKSDELIPKIELDAENLVLNEADGTLELEVYLTDAGGATSYWKETELPAEAANDYQFMGEFEGHKYYFSRYSYKWKDANQNAQDVGGQLLVIDSKEENEFISSIMIHNGTWLGTKREDGDASWSNVYGTLDYTNFENNNGYTNNTGYALTYGNKWYVHGPDDYRHFILEYGPVTSSELPSTVNIVFADDSTATKGDTADGTADYKSSAETFTIPAGSQSATVTLTGLQDTNEEPIEVIKVSIASPSNVELGAQTALEIQVKDDEKPVVYFEASLDTISENGGKVVIQANLSNAKLDPTIITLGLDGTSTPLEDYNISSIFKYSSFVGKLNEPGSREGFGDQARFSPFMISRNIDGSLLLTDNQAQLIYKIQLDGTVSKLLGRTYNCRDEVGSADEVGICDPRQVAVDSQGNLYWGRDRRIMGYNPNTNQVSIIFNGDNGGEIGHIGGLAVLKNEIYFSDFDKHTINKLVWNGSSYEINVVAGVANQSKNMWSVPNQDPRPMLEANFHQPTWLTADEQNNRLIVNTGMPDWNWDQLGRLQFVDFVENSVRDFPSFRNYVQRTTGVWPEFGKIDFDSSGNMYVPIMNINAIYKLNVDENGYYYLGAIITDEKMKHPSSVVVSNGSLYVSNYYGNTVDKIGLGATIEIPAQQYLGEITLDAFKDPWFEEDETIDIKVANLSNATVESNDIEVVTILESTKLTLVQDAPFEGVENGKVSWGDYDKDGDMDLALMGQSSTGTITNVYVNNNGTFENTNQNFTKFIGGDIEFVDVNQDGYLDVAVAGNAEGNVRKAELYINEEGNFFSKMDDYNVEGLSQSDMEWGDLDNDGDPDLIIAGIDKNNEFQTYYYTNLGDFNFLNEGLFNEVGMINGEIDIVDADQDGDNDLFSTGTKGSTQNRQFHSGRIKNTYYREGYDEDVDYNNYGFNVNSGFMNGNAEYADLDGDGELDFLAIGEDGNGNIELQTNLATLNKNIFKLKNVDFDFADYNNDGQSDMIIAGEDPNTGEAKTMLFTTYPAYFGNQYGIIKSDLQIQGLRESSVDWIDYDKDGDLDLFLTGLDDNGLAKAMLYKADNTNNLNTPPSKITNLTATADEFGTVEFKWDKPTDNSSSEFRYSIKIGTGEDKDEDSPTYGEYFLDNIIYSNSNAETGSTLINIPSLSTQNSREVILNPGTYYAAVQAIDGGNMGGPFSDTISITLDYEWKLLNLGGIIDRRLIPRASTQLDFMDMDGDGDKDLIATNLGLVPNRERGGNDVQQQAINVYAFDNEVFVPVYSAHYGESNFEFGDFNNDGQQDVIVAIEENSGTRLRMFLNTRIRDDERQDDPDTPQDESVYREFWDEVYPFDNNNGEDFLQSVYNIKFAIKDLDNDGLVEIITAGQNSKLANEATTVMTMVSVEDVDDQPGIGFSDFKMSERRSVVEEGMLDNLSFASYDFGDIDNDGDYDFLISGYSFDGYKTLLFENKRKKDENGVAVVPVEVYYEEVDNDFVSVKEGTADFVDFDADGKLDVLFSGQSSNGDLVKAYSNTDNGYVDLDVGLPAVRNGRFVFGDFDSNGFKDVLYSGTVSGVGKVTKINTWIPQTGKMIDSGYDLSDYEQANMGVADFDGDLDADVVITGKNSNWNNNGSWMDQYISDILINVRGFAGPDDSSGGIANDGSGDALESGPLKKSVGSKKVYGLNARPLPPTNVEFQRSRLQAFNPVDNNGDGNLTSSRAESSENSNYEEGLFEMVISWRGAVDIALDGQQTPAEGLTYSMRIGTSPGASDIMAPGADVDGVKAAADPGNVENNLQWKINVPQGDYYVAIQSIDASFVGSKFTEEQKYTVTSAFKLGDSNGDDGVNVLDLTTNLDYILGNNPSVFVSEVADVNDDGNIDVTDISAIVNIILNGNAGISRDSNYDPYDWEYFSNKPIGDASLVLTKGRVYLENDKPVTSLQFSMDATVDYELSSKLEGLNIVDFVEDGKRTFLIYSYDNKPIDQLTDVIFDYIDVNENDNFEITNMRSGTAGGLVLDVKFLDESFFDALADPIKMYPNPTSSNVNILTDVTTELETLSVNIYNVLGVSVYQTTIESMGRLNDLDVSMLASGVYTVQVKMITKGREEIKSVHKLIKK